MRFEDPTWQRLLYVYATPIFRVMHKDRNNIIPTVLTLTSPILILRSSYIFGVCSILMAALIFTAKRYLVCGPMTKVYKTNRHYSKSSLKVSDIVPRLYLNEETPYKNGYAYGIIMCDEIIHLVTRFNRIARPNVESWFLNAVYTKLPEEIRDELKGLYDAVIYMKPGSVTLWDLLTIQMVPELDNMGCTCYAAWSEQDHKVVFGRNMDWLPFSSAQYSIVTVYQKDHYNSLTVPGLIGCVTAWNSNFCLAMNVVGLPYELDENLLPSTLFNKMIMIQASTFVEASTMASRSLVMGPYHLTLACSDDAHCYSYYQNPTHDGVVVRKLSEQRENLDVLNWTYPSHDHGRYISKYRHRITGGRTEKGYFHVSDILRQTQTFETMHTFIRDYSNDITRISINNGFAAD